MSTSLPSREIIIVDVPEVERFDCQFQYNFFMKDEKVNETGGIPPSILDKDADAFEPSYIDFISSRTPRFVRFDFSPVVLRNYESSAKDGQPTSVVHRGLIKQNLNKIINEDEFADIGYVSVDFQDANIDEKLQRFVSGSQLYILEQPFKEGAKLVKMAGIVGMVKPITPTSTSPLMSFKFNPGVFSNTNTIINVPLMQKLYLGPQHYSNVFYRGGKKITDDLFEQLKKVRIQTQLSTKFANTLVNSSLNNPMSMLEHELAPLSNMTRVIQEKARLLDAGGFDINNYKTTMQYIAIKISDAKDFKNRAEVVGYIIDKWEILATGEAVNKEPIIIESQKTCTTIDLKVKYATRYAYSIRTIVRVDFSAISEDTHEIVIATALVSSKPSHKIYLDCQEYKPPPPPADVDARWDYGSNKMMISWNFPPNSQRDIKKFQIFRRKSIYEPYQLQKEYNFDDTIGALSFEDRGEFPTVSLVENVDSPVNFWFDDEFTKDSKLLYAICSIDAHGLTSGYSAQMEISFDRFKNKLVRNVISRSDAPKAYPNIYLMADTFIDGIYDAGHKQVKVYFMPEHYSVISPTRGTIELLTTKQKNAEYRYQIINLDQQQQQVVTITLDDQRKHVPLSYTGKFGYFKSLFKP